MSGMNEREKYSFATYRHADYLSIEALPGYKHRDKIHWRIMIKTIRKSKVELLDLEPAWSKSALQSTRLLTHCYNRHDKRSIIVEVHIRTVVSQLQQLLGHMVAMYKVGDYLEVILDSEHINGILKKHAPLAGRLRYKYKEHSKEE